MNIDRTRRLEIVPSQVAVHFATVKPLLALLKLCDGTRSFDAWCAASRVSAEQMARIVDRLIPLGVLRETAPPRRQYLSKKALDWISGRLPDFSSDEEHFFASTIDHLLETG
jgi:hypothetical protein